VLVDETQPVDSQALAKLVEHPDIGDGESVGQTSESPPVSLFGQHLDQEVEGMNRGEQSEQMESVQLGRTESSSASTPWGGRKQFVDELVGNIRVEFVQECDGAGGWEQGVHEAENYPKNHHLSAENPDPSFFQYNLRARKHLHRIS